VEELLPESLALETGPVEVAARRKMRQRIEATMILRVLPRNRRTTTRRLPVSGCQVPEPRIGWQDAEMAEFTLGKLVSRPASMHTDLLAERTRAALEAWGLLDSVAVAEIDPALSDTASTQAAFELEAQMLANCVVVGGKREGVERLAACVVLANTRADVNATVRRHLDVRKASFLAMERATELTSMEYGGITPIGLPAAWPVLVDSRVVAVDVVVIGSGVRRSKILLPGALLSRLPGAEVIEGLGI
jgi:prolyl-tRNA editing enzyme YbaK/EbsC (Cys-tRNA(Pro) deacylase)